jgi:transcriptional regulator with XRE-family HTH domain
MLTQGSARLAEYRDRWKLKQYELAERITVTNAYLSQILSGKRRPSLPIAVRIERETGIPVESWTEPQVGKSENRGRRRGDKAQAGKVLHGTASR